MEPYRKFFTNQKINPSASLPKKQAKNTRSNKNLKRLGDLNIYTAPASGQDEMNTTRASFVNHFLEMVQVYLPTIKEETEKKQLKISWRWIKDVVKEWDEQKNDIKQLAEFFEQVKEHLGLDDDEDT